jgi:hypothetical protein
MGYAELAAANKSGRAVARWLEHRGTGRALTGRLSGGGKPGDYHPLIIVTVDLGACPRWRYH